MISSETKDALCIEDPKSQEILYPILKGGDLARWQVCPEGWWIIYTPKGLTDIEKYPAVKSWLNTYHSALLNRATDQEWFELQQGQHAYFEGFMQEGICFPDMSQGPKFSWAPAGYLYETTTFKLNADLALLAFLNSKLAWFCLQGEANALRGGTWRLRLKRQYVEQIPVPTWREGTSQDLERLATLAASLSEARLKLQTDFTRRIPDLCPPEREAKLNTKLKEWWTFPGFAEFRAEVKKVFKADIPLSERSDWEDWLTRDRAEINRLTAEIAQAEAEIDAIVYDLFDLTEEEINDHKEEQARLRREAKSRDPVFRTAARQRADLTKRDKYRFRVTSAFFKELDRKRIPISDAQVNGRFKLTIAGETINGTVIEKMHKAYTSDVEPWTAWPEHHAGRLKPSGFLRLKIEAPWAIQMELVESETRKADLLIPQLVLFADALEPRLREKQEEQRMWQAEYEARKQEEERRAREARQEEERWQQFRSKAGDFEEAQRLRAFIAALRSSSNETGKEIDGKSMGEWLAWAEARANALDPLTDPTQVFKRPKQNWWG